ncbi:MAG: D-2-hydroxyacid dehydrogenase [Acutalibacteraceae bacterium]
MNLLVTGAWNGAKDKIKLLENNGHCVCFLQFEKDKLPCAYEWVEGIIGNGVFLFHPIEKFVNLKYIQLTSAGFDRVPMDYVKDNNIEIHNAKGVYSIPMAEFAIAGVLQLYKQMDFFRKQQKSREWNKHRGLLELFGKTVCIVGCGNVGTECAKRFGAFGCDVVGVDILPREDKNYLKMVGLNEFNKVLPEADILVLTLPLTDDTKHIMDKDKLALLKKTAVIVNIARGAVIDTQALAESVKQIGGAVLDVFEDEPLNNHSPLWGFENVIITPHNSFVGDNNQKRLDEVIMRNLKVE